KESKPRAPVRKSSAKPSSLDSKAGIARVAEKTKHPVRRPSASTVTRKQSLNIDINKESTSTDAPKMNQFTASQNIAGSGAEVKPAINEPVVMASTSKGIDNSSNTPFSVTTSYPAANLEAEPDSETEKS